VPCPPSPLANLGPFCPEACPSTCAPPTLAAGVARATSALRITSAPPLASLAQLCPLVQELRRAAGAARAIRLTLAIGSLAGAARVEMAAALLAAQALPDNEDPRRRGSLTGSQHRLLCGLAAACPLALRTEWMWTTDQAARLSAQLSLLVGDERNGSPLQPCDHTALLDTTGWRRV
jgi:hypothetical protein